MADSNDAAAQVAINARSAFTSSAQLTAQDRVRALKCIRESLVLAKSQILQANAADVEAADRLVQEGKLSASLMKRLDLQSSATKFDSMVDGVDQVAALRDPCDRVTVATQLDDELELFRISCPIGVILVIFEARPEVIVNIAALAIKSGVFPTQALYARIDRSHQVTRLFSKAARSLCKHRLFSKKSFKPHCLNPTSHKTSFRLWSLVKTSKASLNRVNILTSSFRADLTLWSSKSRRARASL